MKTSEQFYREQYYDLREQEFEQVEMPDYKYGGTYTIQELFDALRTSSFPPERENLLIDYRTEFGRYLKKRLQAEGLSLNW